MRYAALLLLLLAAPVSGQVVDDRTIMFSTQDRNGLHMITISSRGSEAIVRLISPPASRGEPRAVPYPRERFDAAWNALMALDLAAYEQHDPKQDAGAADNFVILTLVGTGRRNYGVPKCSAPNNVRVFVDDLTLGLVPSGSPGLFRPCKNAAETGAGPGGGSR